jgi:RNA-directed DNA polymerase
MSGGKPSSRGTPQGGVVSPLLANIYMHRFIKAFRRHTLDCKHDAVLVTYADDLVVLCRWGAEQVLDKTRVWMEKMGLSLNESKTSVRDATRQSFDFLGYTFGPMYSPRTGGCYTGATASRKAVKRLHQSVRHVLHRGNPAPTEEVVKMLNRVLGGWANYFCYGTQASVRHNVDRYVYDRVRHFLRRRRNIGPRGTSRFMQQWVYRSLGVVEMRLLPRKRFANASA